MLNETTDENTWRFQLYTKMLELKIDLSRHEIIVRPESSTIFVQPVAVAQNSALKQQIIARYEEIFREMF